MNQHITDMERMINLIYIMTVSPREVQPAESRRGTDGKRKRQINFIRRRQRFCEKLKSRDEFVSSNKDAAIGPRGLYCARLRVRDSQRYDEESPQPVDPDTSNTSHTEDT